MRTFIEPREFVENTRYAKDRQDSLRALDLGSIDKPIVDLVSGFVSLPHCFTLQCCYGHFICAPGQDPNNLEPIPRDHVGIVRYKIAYFAFSIENSRRGRAFRHSLEQVPEVAPDYVQFGSAVWFWDRCVNSYALQVEPIAHQHKDEALLESAEALRTQEARDLFFRKLKALLAAELSATVAGS